MSKNVGLVVALVALLLGGVALYAAIQPEPEARGAPLYKGSFVAGDNDYVKLENGAEGIGGPLTIDSAAITYQSSGALWTVGSGEMWFVHAVYCAVSTNFDCTGDNCTLTIGDGNDANGFLDLVDAEMQSANTEFTGAPTGWSGLSTGTMGAYLSGLAPFVYTSTDTIDIAVGGTDPAAGAGTCYVVYERVQ